MISNKEAHEDAEEFQAELNRLDSINLDLIQKRELGDWEIGPISSLAQPPRELTASKRGRGFRNKILDQLMRKLFG